MFRNVARTLAAIVPALALAACGPGREEELERQLAEAQAATRQEAAARQQAEHEAAAARAKANQADLAKFYQGDSADTDGNSAAETEPDSPRIDAPAAAEGPAGMQADGRPVGDEMPAPR